MDVQEAAAGADVAVAVAVEAEVGAVGVAVEARERIADRVTNMGKGRTRILPRTSRHSTKAEVEAAAAALPVAEAGSQTLSLSSVKMYTCPCRVIQRHRQMW